ncbi:hypothetical protein BESB_000140 [Besnoitia besnoiti]|uniref:Uncharacterized protein n=1 Tax=Besnoitia besnoiti TaxID=94643 RepID=A0A2A9MPF1_BESBE|nr:hypothetical protein BESB_000140 [Besnoitia besnoiti]PFH37672.1 hypothetical protein BESB_000140 [Besnoitia besnoiti]
MVAMAELTMEEAQPKWWEMKKDYDDDNGHPPPYPLLQASHGFRSERQHELYATPGRGNNPGQPQHQFYSAIEHAPHPVSRGMLRRTHGNLPDAPPLNEDITQQPRSLSMPSTSTGSLDIRHMIAGTEITPCQDRCRVPTYASMQLFPPIRPAIAEGQGSAERIPRSTDRVPQVNTIIPDDAKRIAQAKAGAAAYEEFEIQRVTYPGKEQAPPLYQQASRTAVPSKRSMTSPQVLSLGSRPEWRYWFFGVAVATLLQGTAGYQTQHNETGVTSG